MASKKVKVEVLRAFCIGKGQDVYPGDVVEVDETDAKGWFQTGRAKAAVEAPPPPEPVEDDDTKADTPARGRGRASGKER